MALTKLTRRCIIELLKILDRYLLREFIGPFFLSLFVLAFILLMDRLFLLVDLLVRKGVGLDIVGQIMFLSLPSVIAYTSPLGTLIGSVMVMGRLAQDNEITAIRASGISLFRMFLPLGILAFGLMIVMMGFNGFLWPESEHEVRGLLMDVARKKPAARIQEGVFMDDFEGYTIYIGRMDDRHSRIYDVALFTKDPKGTPNLVTAKSGTIGNSPDEKYLILTLFDGEIHELIEKDRYRRLAFSKHTVNIPIDVELVRKERTYRGDRELILSALFTKINGLNKEIKELRSTVKGISKKELDKQSIPADPKLLKIEQVETKVRYKKQEMTRYLVETHKKFSLAFSCFFFLFFGAPLGIQLRRGGLGIGFIVGLVFFAIYYILLIAGEDFADSGKVSPFIGMWLPNIVLVPFVIELFLRSFFEKSIIRSIRKSLIRIKLH
ncbi:MAG: LptF/LptG family permease [candidate division WOR-3 bacterium]|nr:LptF/LptG family permease [candidate division WOR-3 bacterium]